MAIKGGFGPHYISVNRIVLVGWRAVSNSTRKNLLIDSVAGRRLELRQVGAMLRRHECSHWGAADVREDRR